MDDAQFKLRNFISKCVQNFVFVWDETFQADKIFHET